MVVANYICKDHIFNLWALQLLLNLVKDAHFSTNWVKVTDTTAKLGLILDMLSLGCSALDIAICRNFTCTKSFRSFYQIHWSLHTVLHTETASRAIWVRAIFHLLIIFLLRLIQIPKKNIGSFRFILDLLLSHIMKLPFAKLSEPNFINTLSLLSDQYLAFA